MEVVAEDFDEIGNGTAKFSFVGSSPGRMVLIWAATIGSMIVNLLQLGQTAGQQGFSPFLGRDNENIQGKSIILLT